MRRLFIVTIALLVVAACGAVARNPVPTGASTPLFSYVFDDGNDTDFLVAKDIFSEQSAVASAAITTDWIGTPGHLTAAQIIGLRDAGWEIMSHTVSHPNLQSLTAAQIESEFSRSKEALEKLGVTVHNVVYPYNKNNELVRQIAAKYYRSGRGGAYAVNTAMTDPYYLKSFPYKHDLAGMEGHIDKAYTERSWIIVYQHETDIKVDIAGKQGTFMAGEKLIFSPSGAEGRYEAPAWFQYFGSLYFVPLSGTPREGDRIIGQTSKATARLDHIIYDDRAAISDMIRYVKTKYPDMSIVTIDEGLDILGMKKKD
ncbi:MAG TPA: polysaccharide deacetylase family protein [Nitrospirota bacterium]|nr:polysaccharide deacetylase family protein [Nitrospirota bacterium]